MSKYFILLFLTLICLLELTAQDKGSFRGYVQGGFGINQMSGDSMAGFNYWGLRGGGGAYFMMTKNFSLNMDLNYVMRGASGEVYDQFNSYQYHRAIQTGYIELPLIVNYHDGNIARFGVGPVLNTLIHSSFYYNKRKANSDSTSSLLKRFDLGLVISVTFDIKKHFGFNLRMNQSLIPINNPRPTEENQYNNSLSANLIYYF